MDFRITYCQGQRSQTWRCLRYLYASCSFLCFLLQDYEEITLELMSLSGWSQEDKLPPESLHPIIMSMADRIHTRQTQLGFHPVVMLVGSVFSQFQKFSDFCHLLNI